MAVLIVIGVDVHKSSHTCAAVQALTGQTVATRAVAAREHGLGVAHGWSRELDDERVWAVEDRRHVSGRLERFLIARGERVVRVAPPADRTRHRLDPGGNRQLNAALHRIAITQIRTHPPAKTYLDKKLAEDKTHREAVRCLKRQLARTLWRVLLAQPSTASPVTQIGRTRAARPPPSTATPPSAACP